MNKKSYILILIVFSLCLTAQLISAEQPHGTFKAGYIYTDEVGNNGVYQPTYNMFEGTALSLEDFSYRLENGTRLYGDFKNVTLNNRSMYFGAAKTGLFNVKATHNQYRRTYSFDGDKSTRRENSNLTAWAQAHKNVRIFAGYGIVSKKGESIELTEPSGFIGRTSFDYSQKYFNVGARCNYKGSFIEVEYRGGEFDDDINSANQRNTKQYRVAATSLIPGVKNLFANAGFQRFELGVDEFNDSLIANTGWGGLRYLHQSGLYVKYSFIWDRARRTGDQVSTDNISNSVVAGKNWRGKGGISVGYRHSVNDDVFDELSTDGYILTAWVKPIDRFTVRGGFGSEQTEVEAGQTLTGNRDVTRYNASIKYDHKQLNWRARIEDKSVENESIGSTADYLRAGTDVSLTLAKYGELVAAYDFLKGDYQNAEGSFKLSDHVIWGNLISARYNSAQVGFGGTYVRSKQDVDIESFSMSIMANYLFSEVYKFEIKYSAHNFDDLNNANTSLIYSKYYTANIVEVYISREF